MPGSLMPVVLKLQFFLFTDHMMSIIQNGFDKSKERNHSDILDTSKLIGKKHLLRAVNHSAMDRKSIAYRS